MSNCPRCAGQTGRPPPALAVHSDGAWPARPAPRELAFNHRFKLHRTGNFFALGKDIEEKQPLQVASFTGEAAAAAKRLQGALDQFKDARPRQPGPTRREGRQGEDEEGEVSRNRAA